MSKPKDQINIVSTEDDIESNSLNSHRQADPEKHAGLNESEKSSVFGVDRHQLKPSLKQRHIQMLALCLVFGTGVFLSSGGVLATTGPLGALLAYGGIAVIVGLNQMALAEVAALMPVTSATVRHLEQFVDPAWGFAYGWIQVYTMILPGEVSAAALIVSYWSDVSQGVWITVIIVFIVAVNSYSVRFYGEVEFVFALIKIALLLGLIIVSIVITSGGAPNHEVIGFRFWKKSNIFKEYITNGGVGKFAGFWKTFTAVVYSYGSVQAVPNLSAEVKNPRRTVFTACKRVFYRVGGLMIVTIFCLTLIVSADDPSIANSSGNASSSPFVIAMKNANIKVLPHIVNAGVLTSAFSAANAAVVTAARTLFALAVKGQAPKVFLKTNKRGLPWVGTLFAIAFLPLAYMNISKSAANVFSWFQALGSANLLLGWILISANHIHLKRAMKSQGIPTEKLPHRLRFTTVAAWISGVAAFILLITAGFANFVHGHFKIADFFSAYFVIPLSLGLYFSWKFAKGTRYYRPHEVQLDVLFKDIEENPEDPPEKLTGWKIITLLWN